MKRILLVLLACLGFASPGRAVIIHGYITGYVDLIWKDGTAHNNVHFRDEFLLDPDIEPYWPKPAFVREASYDGLGKDMAGIGFSGRRAAFTIFGSGAYIWPGSICDCVHFDIIFEPGTNYDWHSSIGPISISSYGDDWYNLQEISTPPGYEWYQFKRLAYRDFTFTAVAQEAVPEPASWAMMIGGFSVVGAFMRKRTSSTAAMRES